MNSSVEVWRKHPNIEKLEVSSLGRIRSVDGHYYINRPDHGGYLRVSFRMNGKKVNKLVHRLVAETFINNPDGLPQVNHKDCNRKNNNVKNLEWCTPKYNRQYQERFGEATGHSLFAISSNKLKVSHFHSQHEAGRILGIFQQHITNVIKGKRNQTHGYWFVNDDDNAVDAVRQKLDELGKTELKAKDGASAKLINQVMEN